MTGDLRASRRMLEAALSSNRAVLGDGHSNTLRTGLELAATMRRLGELEPARTLARTIYTIYQETRPADFDDRLACANVLALALSSLGNHGEGLELGEESVEGHRALLGSDHQLTLAVTGNVAIFLRRLGELDRAREIADKVVARLIANVGADHPYALQTWIVVANIRFAAGSPADALEIEKRVYEQMAEKLGPSHPERLVAGCNMAASRQALGDTDGLAEFRDGLHAVAARVLGRNHPIATAILTGERWECEMDLSSF